MRAARRISRHLNRIESRLIFSSAFFFAMKITSLNVVSFIDYPIYIIQISTIRLA